MYLLDSDVCAEILRNRLPGVMSLLQKSSPDLFGISAIVEAELRYGAEHSSYTEKNRLNLERFLSYMTIIPFDSKCAVQYARIREDLGKRGCLIGSNDMLIAATALATSSVLVTNNTREFSRVTGLMFESWAEADL